MRSAWAEGASGSNGVHELSELQPGGMWGAGLDLQEATC